MTLSKEKLAHYAAHTEGPVKAMARELLERRERDKQEPVADVVAWRKDGEERTCDIRWRRFDVAPGPLFTRPLPPGVPDGYCIMPLKLTAANGAKAALSGEFHVNHHIVCGECAGEGCESCNEEGGWEGEILIGWDTIKRIHEAAVEACALPESDNIG